MQKMRIITMTILSFILIGCSRVTLVYLTNAESGMSSESPAYAFSQERPEAVKLLLNGHYIKTGNNVVLLIRKFDRGQLFTIDDESYEKLTIEIKDFRIGQPINIDSDDTKLYFSAGSSGFAYKGHGIYSSHGSGTITIKQEEKDKLVTYMDISILAKPAGVFPFEDKIIRIKETLIFDKKGISELTPWLGLPDPSIGKEVYP